MNALEKKVINMFDDFKKENNSLPLYAKVVIRWNDDKEYVRDTIFALYEYDGVTDSDTIFFYCADINDFLSICANIDFVRDDFYCMDDFIQEVDKYDTDDPDSLDWTYLHRGEDFCIVDIVEFFN